MAYLQAEIKTAIYLHPPAGIIINTHGEDQLLKLKKNLYGLKDSGTTWWEHLSEGLEEMGFRQCQSDQCVWMKDGVVIVVYVDDCLIFANEDNSVIELIAELKRKFDITDEGDMVEEYLGVKIDHNKYGSFRMYQPHLMDRILKLIPRMDKANKHIIPAATTSVLTKYVSGKGRQEN